MQAFNYKQKWTLLSVSFNLTKKKRQGKPIHWCYVIRIRNVNIGNVVFIRLGET